ncbi:MAG: hypothetical protein HFE62_00680 [Firmicutes bacterium]|nr:hypothetical protein [Bacillota bacterium]
MENISSFCTCTDLKCKFNPANHDKGCSFCVEKCLKLNEIPSCFFKIVKKDGKPKGYSFKDFAETVLENE